MAGKGRDLPRVVFAVAAFLAVLIEKANISRLVNNPYLLVLVFVICRINIKVEVRVISLSLRLWQNPYLNLDYSGYHKNPIK